MKNYFSVTSFLVVIALCSVVLSTIKGSGELFNYINLQKSFLLLEKNVLELKKEKKNLKDEINRITSSSSYARKVYRDKYHALEKGEEILFFAD
jgi:cell division protein FtsB